MEKVDDVDAQPQQDAPIAGGENFFSFCLNNSLDVVIKENNC